MPIHTTAYQDLVERTPKHVLLLAVSKKQSNETIAALYHLGQRHFGENYVQELCDKQPHLPSDIHWHFIGHLQSNKVKYIAPFVYCIHSVDSTHLLDEIEKQAKKQHRTINVLIQVHIAQEVSKFGITPADLAPFLEAVSSKTYQHICVRGLMGMSTFTEDRTLIQSEFALLKTHFDAYKKTDVPFFQWDTLSMGMSHDYAIAIEEGSTLLRIGSLIFGDRS